MTKRNLIEMYNVFESLSNIKNVEFMYPIIQNKLKIKNDVDAIKELSEPSEKYLEFLREKNKAINKYAKRDKNDNIISKNNDVLLQKDKLKEFEAVIISLEDKFKDAIKEYKKQQEKVEKILDEKIEVEFKKIDYESIPKDEVNGEQLEILFPIIKE